MGFPKAQWLTSSSLPAFRSAGHVTPRIFMLSCSRRFTSSRHSRSDSFPGLSGLPFPGDCRRLWGSDSRGQVGGVSSPLPTRRKIHAAPDPQPMKHPTRHTLLSSTPPKSRQSHNHPVLIGNQGRGLNRGPGPLQLFQADLDHGDTDRLPLFRQRRRQVYSDR